MKKVFASFLLAALAILGLENTAKAVDTPPPGYPTVMMINLDESGYINVHGTSSVDRYFWGTSGKITLALSWVSTAPPGSRGWAGYYEYDFGDGTYVELIPGVNGDGSLYFTLWVYDSVAAPDGENISPMEPSSDKLTVTADVSSPGDAYTEFGLNISNMYDSTEFDRPASVAFYAINENSGCDPELSGAVNLIWDNELQCYDFFHNYGYEEESFVEFAPISFGSDSFSMSWADGALYAAGNSSDVTWFAGNATPTWSDVTWTAVGYFYGDPPDTDYFPNLTLEFATP